MGTNEESKEVHYDVNDTADELYFVAKQYDSMDEVVEEVKFLKDETKDDGSDSPPWKALRIKTKSGSYKIEEVSYKVRELDLQELHDCRTELNRIRNQTTDAIDPLVKRIEGILDNVVVLETASDTIQDHSD